MKLTSTRRIVVIALGAPVLLVLTTLGPAQALGGSPSTLRPEPFDTIPATATVPAAPDWTAMRLTNSSHAANVRLELAETARV
ncbi:MAG TPA: hypothetical protein VHZ06_07930 [Marmoricola sp.]|jgi:hypothetical protein|nr:hypothetical protein [Marmoricola sp.]